MAWTVLPVGCSLLRRRIGDLVQEFWPGLVGLEGTFLVYSFFSASSFQDGGAAHKS